MNPDSFDAAMMRLAIDQARNAALVGEVPGDVPLHPEVEGDDMRP